MQQLRRYVFVCCCHMVHKCNMLTKLNFTSLTNFTLMSKNSNMCSLQSNDITANVSFIYSLWYKKAFTDHSKQL